MKEIFSSPDAVTIENGILTKYCGDGDTVVVPEGVTEIAKCAFFRKAHIKEIVLPKSLKKIGEYAFYGACGFAEICLPEGLCEIGEYAFSRCHFREIVIPVKLLFFWCSRVTSARAKASSSPSLDLSRLEYSDLISS